MKKKVLLLLPALMVLSACGGASTNSVKTGLFQEDTELHEEIFKEAQPIFEGKAVRNLDPVEPSLEPYIGIQSKIFEETIENVTTQYISVRFVAALALESEDTVVQWTRTMYEDDGDYYSGMPKKVITCAYTYTDIYDNGVKINIKSIGDGNYTHFVAYTLRKIPLVAFGNYYLNMSLTIGGEASDKVVSTTINQEKQIAFDSSVTGLILGGSINGNTGSVAEDNPKAGDGKASFSSHFSSTDNFMLLLNNTKEETPKFEIYSYNLGNTGETYFTRDSHGKISPKATGDYTIYLGNDDYLYAANRVLYMSGTMNSWLNTGTPDEQYVFTYDSTSKSYTLTYTFAANAEFGFRNTTSSLWGQNTNSWLHCGYVLADSDHGNIKIPAAGTYTVHLFLEDKVNPIGLSGDGIVTRKPAETALFIRGNAIAGGWDPVDETYKLSKSDEEGYLYEIKNVAMTTGDDNRFTIASYDYRDQWGFWGYRLDKGDYIYPGSFVTGTAIDGECFVDYGDWGIKDIKCMKSGSYDIYIKDDYRIVINIHTA